MTHAAHPVRPAHQARTQHAATLPMARLQQYRCDGPYVRADHVLDLPQWACSDRATTDTNNPEGDQ